MLSTWWNFRTACCVWSECISNRMRWVERKKRLVCWEMYGEITLTMEARTTYLISENANAACRGDLIRAEPHCRYLCREGQDENLRGSYNRLSDESHPEKVRLDGETFYPGTQTGAQYSADCCDSQALLNEYKVIRT